VAFVLHGDIAEKKLEEKMKEYQDTIEQHTREAQIEKGAHSSTSYFKFITGSMVRSQLKRLKS
jgi:hypothetical protein